MIFKFAPDQIGQESIDLIPNPKSVSFDGKNFIVRTEKDIMDGDFVFEDTLSKKVFNVVSNIIGKIKGAF